jgi:hypothetical protein
MKTTRGQLEATVLRIVRCLFGLYSVVSLRHERLRSQGRATTWVTWPGEERSTYSDAIMTVRRGLGSDWDLHTNGQGEAFWKLPRAFRETLSSAANTVNLRD